MHIRIVCVRVILHEILAASIFNPHFLVYVVTFWYLLWKKDMLK